MKKVDVETGRKKSDVESGERRGGRGYAFSLAGASTHHTCSPEINIAPLARTAFPERRNQTNCCPSPS
ncbi:unnamed protein product [Ectocarpus sp. 8 AP-2014]